MRARNLDEVGYIIETSLTIRRPRRRTTVPKEISRAQAQVLKHKSMNDLGFKVAKNPGSCKNY